MIYVNAKFLTKSITGVERYATEISYALKKIDSSILFLIPNQKAETIIYQKFNTKCIAPFKEYFWEQLTLPFYLKKKRNPLLINLTNTAPILYKNQILVIHDLAFLHEPKWYTKKAKIVFSFLVRQAAKVSPKIVTVSNFTKQEVIKYLKIPSERITVIPGAVPSYISLYEKENFDNKYGEYILTVSSIEPRKNILNLVAAFLRLNNPSIKLVVVGKANSRVFNTINYDFAQNKNIILTGYISDEELVGLYKNARLFAYLSYYEGFGFPPLEAIYCGCPALVSNTTSLPEICGDLAEYCNPDDVDGIASKMELILSRNKRNNKEGIRLLKQKFDWQRSAEMILDLANDVQ